jgi:hypothetical protein
MTEMGLWKRCVRKILPDKVRNEVIREEGEVEETIKDRIDEKRLMWYGHVRRTEAHRLPRQSLERRPAGRRKGGRSRRIWNGGTAELMKEGGLPEEDAENLDRWKYGARNP